MTKPTTLELAKETIVYRIQDKDGRGPWKPGFSHRWVVDREDLDNLAPFYVEFGQTVFDHAILGMFLGSACESVEQLKRWFTPEEYKALKSFGYQSVKMQVGRILASSAIQCVIERSKPLNRDVEVFELYVS